MLRKELTAALAIVGAITPFTVQADQPMAGGQANQKPSYMPGEKVRDGQLPGGFNQSANYVVNDGWDVYMTGNYIYWHLAQEGVDMGSLVNSLTTGVEAAFFGSASQYAVNPSYKSGFQVGLGFDMKGMDDWNLYGEYTWYKNNSSNSVSAGSNQTFVLAQDFITQAANGVYTGAVLVANGMSAALNMHYNCADLGLQRPFYMGKKLTANFGCGLRGLWISEKATADMTNVQWAYPLSSDAFTSDGNMSSMRHQKSWALGPRFMLDTNWLLGCGFRMMGDMAASVLYTRYTSLNASGISDSQNLTPYVHDGYNTLRAVTETTLGLGWGTYFGDTDEFHFDLTASYDFNIYWNQNMMDRLAGLSTSPGNMYLHGLNVGLRFDF